VIQSATWETGKFGKQLHLAGRINGTEDTLYLPEARFQDLVDLGVLADVGRSEIGVVQPLTLSACKASFESQGKQMSKWTFEVAAVQTPVHTPANPAKGFPGQVIMVTTPGAFVSGDGSDPQPKPDGWDALERKYRRCVRIVLSVFGGRVSDEIIGRQVSTLMIQAEKASLVIPEEDNSPFNFT
jgi:hypothetical protein